MSTHVDVLAVIEAAARSLWVQGQPVNPHAADLISARAAVAEQQRWVAHLETFVGTSAVAVLRQSFAAGISPGGAAPPAAEV